MIEQNINDAFKNAQLQIRNACDLYDECRLDVNKYELISRPRRILEINIPVRMDNWIIKTFVGYRSQHNNSRWPYKWWIRFHQDVNRSEVKALSMWMTFKCAVLDLPLWGWKWWIIVNPKELSEWELERLSRWWVKELYKYIGPDQDIPAPDVNTNPKIMVWMMDEYSKLVWIYSPWSFTWKPLEAWGSKWRWTATAQGWVYVLESILNKSSENLKNKKIVIQWAWNAGLTMAWLIEDAWAIIVWISDSRWAIYNESWISIKNIKDLKSNKKSVIDYNDAVILDDAQDILTSECDILIPAALENQINQDNAKEIKAKYILELANWPTTHNADTILFERWIIVIPDILANAWWVTVSYFEQVQNNLNYYWEESEVREKLLKRMNESTESVYNASKKYKTHLRAWAYIIAMERVFWAMKARGEV